jgi:hypothetical protein
MPQPPSCQPTTDQPVARLVLVTAIRHPEGTRIVRRRPILRRAVKTALIAKAAQRLGRRAEQHLSKRVEHHLGKH